MIGAMTERSATGTERQAVCPFVAFDDDRDYRSGVPDHRHRCFAESPAATRALAHQAAYCLSLSFPSCPTFIDWARREAAPPKDEPARTLRDTGSTPRTVERPGDGVSRSAAPSDLPATSQRPRRGDWTAPPPWAPDPSAGDATGGRTVPAREPSPVDDAPVGDTTPDDDDVDPNPGLGAWSGSALGGLAPSRDPARDAAPAPVDLPPDADRGVRTGQPGPGAPAFLAGRPPRSNPAGAVPSVPLEPESGRDSPRGDRSRHAAADPAPGGPARRPMPARPDDRDRPIDRSRDRPIDRGSDRTGADPSAPSWERPRRFEAYPSLKSSGSRVAALPRPVLYGLIVLVVGLALFATPFLLRGITGDGGAAATPTPAASASPGASASASATPVPSPSPTIYVVKSGDLLSRIARKFGITVDQIVKANPQIKNPDRLAIGDQLVIPPAVAPAITDSSITTAPSPSP
jgi:hypothetical protein